MGFKLVRIDAKEPSKVLLPVGSHLIGRGKFLDCHDHRVSRKHAELIVTSDSVLLKSLHQNPCFYKKKSSEETIIFSQPDSQVLGNGDQFGLVPETFWYEVIYCLEDSLADVDEKTSNEQDVCVETDNQEVRMNEDTDPYGQKGQENLNYSSDSAVSERSASPSLLPTENPLSTAKNTEGESEIPPLDNPEEMDTTSVDQPIESTDQPNESKDQPAESTDQPEESSDQPAESTDQPEESSEQHVESTYQTAELTDKPEKSSDQPIESTNQVATKRASTQESSSCSAKKVKMEPEESSDKETDDDIKTQQVIKTEPTTPQDVRAGPSNDQGSSLNNSSNNAPPMPQSPTKPPNKILRERCMYGANCYRRNPQHKATFSHPCDSDWGGGARGECPWGAGCRRADPRHWRDHHHPPGVEPPPPRGNRPGMQVVRRNGNNFFINANAVHFYDDHFEVEDSDGDSVDYDYEF